MSINSAGIGVVEKSYSWRILTNDGLLKIPEKVGPYYDEDVLQDDYPTEEAAINDYVRLQKSREGRFASELVLITLYRA